MACLYSAFPSWKTSSNVIFRGISSGARVDLRGVTTGESVTVLARLRGCMLDVSSKERLRLLERYRPGISCLSISLKSKDPSSRVLAMLLFVFLPWVLVGLGLLGRFCRSGTGVRSFRTTGFFVPGMGRDPSAICDSADARECTS